MRMVTCLFAYLGVVISGLHSQKYVQKRNMRIWMCHNLCLSDGHFTHQQFCDCDVIKSGSSPPLARMGEEIAVFSFSKNPSTMDNCTALCEILVNCTKHTFDYNSSTCVISSTKLSTDTKDRQRTIYTIDTVMNNDLLGPRNCKLTCVGPNAHCYSGRCGCKPGYCKQSGSCVSDCFLFSNEFSLQSRNRCSRDFALMIKTSSLTICKQQCISMIAAFCAAFQLHHDNCLLMARGKEWPNVDWMSLKGCRYYQRNCEAVELTQCKSCEGPSHRCVNGKCVCAMGYSLLPQAHRCTRGCEKYADTFTLQSTRRCQDSYYNFKASDAVEECQEMCLYMQEALCVAFEFHQGVCYLKTKIHETNPWEDWTECSHYQRNCGGCTEACTLPQYQCRDGSCVCNHGYSLVPGTGTCVERCSDYGVDFSVQTPDQCKNHAEATYETSDHNHCSQRCLEEREFTCVAFYLRDGMCQTMTWSTVQNSNYEWYEIPGCQHYQRHCKST